MQRSGPAHSSPRQWMVESHWLWCSIHSEQMTKKPPLNEEIRVDYLAGPELADHVFPVQSGVRSTVIRKMLMGLTVFSPWKAWNVASIRRHPEDVLCGIVTHSIQRLKTELFLAWIPTQVFLSLLLLKPHIHDSHMTPKDVVFHHYLSLVHQHLQFSLNWAHQILNTHVYSCWF